MGREKKKRDGEVFSTTILRDKPPFIFTILGLPNFINMIGYLYQ